MTKEMIEDMLRRGLVEVVFTKKDGTERNMKCTLVPEWVESPSGTGKIVPNQNVLRVFDMEVEEWRSFRIDSVKSVHMIEEEYNG